MIRLNKYLSESGLFSRRKADEAISAGQIFVNGKAATLGQQIDPETDIVKYLNQIIKTEKKLVYYALYKPTAVISSANDELGRKTVLDFVPPVPRVYPVGRLDEDSEGLIILTNDGELTQKLTHPSFEHEKEYQVRVRIKNKVSSIKEEIIHKIEKSFKQGLLIDNKLMRVDGIEVSLIPNTYYLILNLVLHTGYNRQIRRMCAKIGLEVKQLTRTRIGKLDLAQLDLREGQYKQISKEDIL